MCSISSFIEWPIHIDFILLDLYLIGYSSTDIAKLILTYSVDKITSPNQETDHVFPTSFMPLEPFQIYASNLLKVFKSEYEIQNYVNEELSIYRYLEALIINSDKIQSSNMPWITPEDLYRFITRYFDINPIAMHLVMGVKNFKGVSTTLGDKLAPFVSISQVKRLNQNVQKIDEFLRRKHSIAERENSNKCTSFGMVSLCTMVDWIYEDIGIAKDQSFQYILLAAASHYQIQSSFIHINFALYKETEFIYLYQHVYEHMIQDLRILWSWIEFLFINPAAINTECISPNSISQPVINNTFPHNPFIEHSTSIQISLDMNSSKGNMQSLKRNIKKLLRYLKRKVKCHEHVPRTAKNTTSQVYQENPFIHGLPFWSLNISPSLVNMKKLISLFSISYSVMSLHYLIFDEMPTKRWLFVGNRPVSMKDYDFLSVSIMKSYKKSFKSGTKFNLLHGYDTELQTYNKSTKDFFDKFRLRYLNRSHLIQFFPLLVKIIVRILHGFINNFSLSILINRIKNELIQPFLELYLSGNSQSEQLILNKNTVSLQTHLNLSKIDVNMKGSNFYNCFFERLFGIKRVLNYNDDNAATDLKNQLDYISDSNMHNTKSDVTLYNAIEELSLLFTALCLAFPYLQMISSEDHKVLDVYISQICTMFKMMLYSYAN